MTADAYTEQKAILTRAADVEMKRQAARRAFNLEHERRLHDELRRLWARYSALEMQRGRSDGGLYILHRSSGVSVRQAVD